MLMVLLMVLDARSESGGIGLVLVVNHVVLVSNHMVLVLNLGFAYNNSGVRTV